MPDIALADPGAIDRLPTAPGPVLVDFWQLRCAPCRALEPRLRAALDAHPDVRAVRIDVDTDLATATRFAVTSIPTVLVFRDGQERARLDGLIRQSDIEDALHAATAVS